ncbi:Ubiquitin-conjugating enzyme E2 T, partial [Dispira simplex]
MYPFIFGDAISASHTVGRGDNLSHLNQYYTLKVYLVNGPVQGRYRQTLVDQIALTSWTADKGHMGDIDETQPLADKGIQGILADGHIPERVDGPNQGLKSQRQGISYFSCHDPTLSSRERDLTPGQVEAMILYQPANRPCLPRAQVVVQSLATKVPVFFHTAPEDLFSGIRAYVNQHHIPYTLVVGSIGEPVDHLSEPALDPTSGRSLNLTPGALVETSFLVYVACAVLGIMTIGSVGLLVHRYYCQRNHQPQGASGSYTITIADLSNSNHPVLRNTGTMKRGIDAEILQRFPVQNYTPGLVEKCRMGSQADECSLKHPQDQSHERINHSHTSIIPNATPLLQEHCQTSQVECLDEEALRNREFLVGLDLASELPFGKVPTLARCATIAATLPRFRSSRTGRNSATRGTSMYTLTDLFDATATPISPPIVAKRPSSGFDRWTSQDLCPICLCEFQVGEQVRVLPCHHPFHCECIDPWLLYVSTVCPMCKSNMSEATTSNTGALSEHSMVAPNVGIPRPVRLSSLGLSPPNPTVRLGRPFHQLAQNRERSSTSHLGGLAMWSNSHLRPDGNVYATTGAARSTRFNTNGADHAVKVNILMNDCINELYSGVYGLQGAWKPSLNVTTVLTSICVLLAEPNPDDPLLADVAAEFLEHHSMFLEKARQWTQRHATERKTENDEAQLVADANESTTGATHSSPPSTSLLKPVASPTGQQTSSAGSTLKRNFIA